jgi:dCMP deaminase
LDRLQTAGEETLGLEEFVERDDLMMFGNHEAASRKQRNDKNSMQTLQLPNGNTASTFHLPTLPPPSPELSSRAFSTPAKQDALAPLVRLCNLHIQTGLYASLEELHAHLKQLDLTKEDRMRPGWDRYFMTLAGLASLR